MKQSLFKLNRLCPLVKEAHLISQREDKTLRGREQRIKKDGFQSQGQADLLFFAYTPVPETERTLNQAQIE